jgi:LIVCS family branched-chain amino acid:cation transporter
MALFASCKESEHGIEDADLLYVLAVRVLGPAGSMIATGAVFFACFTTAISLASVFCELFARRVVSKQSFFAHSACADAWNNGLYGNSWFSGIAKILGPVLEILYPSIIVLCLLNMAHKLYGVKLLKAPVFAIFAIGALGYVIPRL